jgi:hypothetical protein
MSHQDDYCMCEEEPPVSLLRQSIYDKSLPPPPPKPQAPFCRQQQQQQQRPPPLPAASFDLANMEIDKVLVEYRFKGQQYPSSNRPRITQVKHKRPLEAPKRLGVCEGLKLAGFQKDWTKEKVARLLKTPDGAELVRKVDMEYRQMTGKASLSEQDILSCYPDYLKYERRNVELLLELDAKENILSVREKKMEPKSKTKATATATAKSKFNLL